jgi:hypothetical protein
LALEDGAGTANASLQSTTKNRMCQLQAMDYGYENEIHSDDWWGHHGTNLDSRFLKMTVLTQLAAQTELQP